jgi:inhibitor of KinA
VRKAQSKEGTIYDFVCCKLEDAIALSSDESEDSKQVFRVPVCYEPEYGPDLESICNMKRLEREEFIRIHTDSVYRVYMVGFLPGFTYLGTLDDRIRVQRKDQPVLVEAGSIGLAGYQTGIYPFSSPGGWQIIGRTPLRFFEPYAEVPVRLQMGDQVKFYPITGLEMREWKLQAETESAN